MLIYDPKKFLCTEHYHSSYYDMLYRVNLNKRWRELTNSSDPDIHMKDIEVLLRGLAMLITGDSYSPSLVRFLNQFSKKCENHNAKKQ